jgi:Histidine kinase-, DNA gyrase B-, and HSP90-like ATPase
MTSARSFGNYDLPGALADLIDNSIKAKARHIKVTCLYNSGDPRVSVLDDGYGMTQEELHAAMRPASANPLAERSPDDLGRFGWGMKSASFSQCKKLTVISRQNGTLSGAEWDLDNVQDWKMGVLSHQELKEIGAPELHEQPGTQILWSDCDRLSEYGTITEDHFNNLIVHTRNRIALIYHKYLFNMVPKRKALTISINGQSIDGYDPFHRDHYATQQLEHETLKVGNARVEIQPYVLPHYSKITLSEYEKLGGEEGFVRNQGFYVYRNHRLIINGEWFRLAKFGELSQLIRISVDIPNSLDDIWKITIDKTDAQLPAILKSRLKQIVDGLKRRSALVFRSKGGRIDSDSDETTVWSRHAKSGEIHYSINRKHPLVASLLGIEHESTKHAAVAVLDVIEQSFPVNSFGEDATKRMQEIHQTVPDPHEFRRQVEAAIPLMLHEVGGDLALLTKVMKASEPFSRNWKTVAEILKEKGWSSAES